MSKNSFPEEIKENSTQIKWTKTNRASIEHKVVLIFSYQPNRNIFSHFSAYIFTRGDKHNCFVGDRDIIFSIWDQIYSQGFTCEFVNYMSFRKTYGYPKKTGWLNLFYLLNLSSSQCKLHTYNSTNNMCSKINSIFDLNK